MTLEGLESVFALERLKHFVSKIGSGKTPSGGATSYLDEGIPFLRSQNVHNGGLRLDDVVFISPEVDREMRGTRVRPGDVLLNITGASLGRVAIVPGSLSTANVNQHVCIIRCRSSLAPGFLWYVLQSEVGGGQIFAEEKGISREGLNFEQVGALRVPVPEQIEAQRAIASFLDRKTAAIDAFIAKKERLIELLQEKRQALTTQAVTKGLDPKVPMKDSGIEWLGTVPAHWKTVRISYVAEVCNGTTPDRNREDYWTDGTVPWLSSGKVNDYFVEEADEFITERALRNTSVRLLPAGTILVGMIGQGKTRGMSAQMMFPACINQNVAGVLPRRMIDGRFLHHMFVTAYQPLREFGRGGQQDALNCDILGAFRIPLPPLDEQRRVARLLDEARARTTALCTLVASHVEKLREYRQALITAAVTGKIDVSKEVA